jgi:hypothetical protein
MRYWWVNNSQTFRHEFVWRCIWSPKRKRDGARNEFYDFLQEVALGRKVEDPLQILKVMQRAGFMPVYKGKHVEQFVVGMKSTNQRTCIAATLPKDSLPPAPENKKSRKPNESLAAGVAS